MPAGYRPDGTPFWGESLAIAQAIDVTGTALGPDNESAIVTRGRIGDSASSITMSSGDTIRAWARSYALYLMEGDSPTLSWVVEVTGGSGDLHLRDDVAVFNAPITDVPSHDQGTRHIAGAGTYTWPVTASVADLLATDGRRPSVQIECSSGAVEIQQVKLRVWPASGPLGGPDGHVDAADDRFDLATSILIEMSISENVTGPDYDATWYSAFAAAQADAAAHPAPGEFMSIDGPAFAVKAEYAADSGVNFDGDVFGTTIRFTIDDAFWARDDADFLLKQLGNTVPGDEGVDYIADPNEVWEDGYAYARPDVPIEFAWSVVTEHLPAPLTTAEAGGGQVPTSADVVFRESSTYISTTYPELGATLDTVTLVQPAPGGSTAPIVSFVDIPGEVQYFRATARHEYTAGMIPPPHGVDSFGGNRHAGATLLANVRSGVAKPDGTFWNRPSYTSTRPPFAFWVPAGPKEILPLRQFPRDDGLRGGPSRMTPGSRQTGRQNGYL